MRILLALDATSDVLEKIVVDLLGTSHYLLVDLAIGVAAIQ